MSLRSFTRAATAATQSLSLIGRASWQRQKRPPYHGHGDGAPQRRIDRGGKPPRRRPPRRSTMRMGSPSVLIIIIRTLRDLLSTRSIVAASAVSGRRRAQARAHGSYTMSYKSTR
jgi:hypothetical protein